MKTACYIPCFNAQKYIAAAIEGLLKQTTQFSEILIVDDGSTDKTFEIASRYPVRIIQHERNKGLAASRNTAWQSLDSEYIASIDADCRPEPDWLEKLLKKFTADTVGVGGRLLEQNTKDIFNKWRSVHMKQCWDTNKINPDFLFGSNTVFSRKALIDVGGYDESFENNYEDVDICRRLKDTKHDLAYEAQAIVWHLKQDNIETLLNSYWQWRRPFYQEQGFYATEKRLQDKMKDNIGLANRCLQEDMEQNRKELVYLDFLLALHHCLRDFQFYLQKQGKNSATDINASLWLSLIDINFCFRLSAKGKNMKTLLNGQDVIGQNFIALVLLIGGGLIVVDQFVISVDNLTVKFNEIWSIILERIKMIA